MVASLNTALDIALFQTSLAICRGKNYHIFCDNFFTSIRLAEDLLAKNLYVWNYAFEQNRFPPDLKQNKLAVKALRCGESIFRRKGNIVATVWKDNKVVSFISTQV